MISNQSKTIELPKSKKVLIRCYSLTEICDEAICIKSIRFTLYLLCKQDYVTDEFVASHYDRAGWCRFKKHYNGMVIPSDNHVMLLGSKSNLNISKWVATVNPELMHYVLHFLGVIKISANEALVLFLKRNLE